MNVIDPVAESNDECRIAPDLFIQRGHAVQNQGFLGLAQRKLCREADPQDDITLLCLFFSGDQFVAVPVIQIGPDEYLLLRKPLLPEGLSNEVREGTGGEFVL